LCCTHREYDIYVHLNITQVEGRYFHTAVGFDDYMLVIGGLTHGRNISSNVLIYKYTCNFWTRLDLSGKYNIIVHISYDFKTRIIHLILSQLKVRIASIYWFGSDSQALPWHGSGKHFDDLKETSKHYNDVDQTK
jgi:hypothetical protein